MTALKSYFKRIGDSAKTIVVGMGITWRYMVRPKEIITIQYGSKKYAPKERYIPDRHRGIHYLETEKCIQCRICEKACPVDCITMESAREPFEGSWQGDGCYVSNFTLDLNKCIFCNLCCEPCPKDCIHMGQEFDVASYTRSTGIKNLLTDRPWTEADRKWEEHAAVLIKQVEEEAKKRKAAAKAAKKPEPAAPTTPKA
jgi:NADH-quinone oxidoreductase subunit I